MTARIVQHLVSGDAFFTATALVMVAVLMRRTDIRWRRTVSNLLALVALAVLIASATPLPTWLTVWLIGITSLVFFRKQQLSRLKTVALVSWLGAAAWEATYRLPPQVADGSRSELIVVGDSLAAGVDEGAAATWPQLLAKVLPIPVLDCSRMGATVKSAQELVPDPLPRDAIVLLEIGGNDLLGETSVADFERELESLLQRVAGDGREVLMFELPLPPFYNRFGHVQRRLARRYHVKLIPRWVLANVIFAPGATLDSLHLTTQGHEQLAAAVIRIL